jgi:hypothetical protein
MPFVNAVPDALMTAAGDLAGIGSALAAARAAAEAPTAGIEAVAADAVSAALVAVFSAHGLGYQSLGSELAELHAQIVQALRSGGRSYAAAEAENASPLGHPLLGNGTGAAPGGGGQPG